MRATFPGASFLDVDDDLSDLSVTGQGRHPLPGAERFAAAAGRAGIGEGVYVVAYGSMGGAERLWWLLRHFGHDDCAVLADGIDAWLGPLSAGDEGIEPAVFTPRERAGDTIEAEEIVARLGDRGSFWSTPDCPHGGAARRTRSTRCPAASGRAERAVERAGPRAHRTVRSSRTAAPASPRP